MFKTIRDNVLLPLFTRLGTALGTALLGAGANAELVEQAILGVIALLLIGFDLGMSYLNRQKAKKEALQNGHV